MDSALFQTVLDFISQHPLLTGLIVFLVAFTESLAIVGLFMPGAVLMFAFGMLIGSGQMAFFDAFIWAVLGAVAGDGISFWLGRHYHQQLKVMWPFRRYPRLIARGSDFFAKHGSKSILFGRFVGPVRPIIPAIAGMMEMPSLKFFFVNLLSALLWAPAYLLPGMAFGASLSLAAEVAGRLVVLLLVLLGLSVITIWLVKHVVNFLQPRSNPLMQRLLRRSHNIRYIDAITEAILDPEHPETKVLGGLFLLLLITSISFALLFQNQLSDGTGGTLSIAVHNLIQTLRIDWADGLMLWLTRFGSLYFLLPFTLLLALVLALFRDRATPLYLLGLLLISQLTVLLLKNTTTIERPISLYSGLHQYSFPSSHSLMAVVIFGFLAVIIAARLPIKWRWLVYSLSALISIIVAFSRLYLQAHWLSDVVAGILIGLIWIALAGIAYRRHHRCTLQTRPLLLLVGTALLLANFFYSMFAPQHLYAPAVTRQPTQIIETSLWYQQQWQELPAIRKDLRGINDHPFNLQWAADAGDISAQLSLTGWQTGTPLSLINGLRFLAPNTPVDELPIPAHIHNSQTQALLYSRKLNDRSLLVIRLWPSSFTLTNQRPIWFGNISIMQLDNPWGWLKLLRTQEDFVQARNSFRNENPHACIQVTERHAPLLCITEGSK